MPARKPRLRPTLTPTRAAHYRRAGGPWDRGSLDDTFAATPATAVVADGWRLGGTAFDVAVGTVAGALHRAGVRRGDVVAWQLPNGIPAVVLYRACWRLGAVAAPLHHRLGSAEVGAALAQVDPRVVLSDPGLPAATVPGARPVDGDGKGERRIDALVAALPPAPAMPHRGTAARPSDLAVALFTSGSTGTPKAVLHTHRALGYKAALMVAIHAIGPADAILMPAPLAHVSGLLNGVLLPATAGIPSVVMSAWDPGQGLVLIERERVSFMGAPPVFFSQMAAVDGFSRDRVRSLRLVSTGGASVSPAFVESTGDTFGCRVKRTYGSTEAPTVTTSGPDDSLDRARDTDGRPVGEVELGVRDPDTGRAVRPGATGEIWLRGPELFVGYADGDATARVVMRGGWFRTGDLGVIDDAGWLRVVGRLSDIIIRAGENISASEVEAVLEAHPDVRHAVAVPVPDPDVGERVAAFVETSGPFDLDSCRTWFASRGVTRFKTPEFVEQVDAIPVLAAGKPDRAALKARAARLRRG